MEGDLLTIKLNRMKKDELIELVKFAEGKITGTKRLNTEDAESILDDFMADNNNDSIQTTWDIRECFRQLRTSKDNGDIRLTIAQQEEICDLVERFYPSKHIKT
jgi:hypothetical protein